MILTIMSLEPPERDNALAYADTVMRRVHGPNYTGLEKADRFYVGRLGELAVLKWADREDLMVEETVNDLGIPDEQDFLFHFKDGRVARVNAKNSLHPGARYLMQPKAQADRHEQDIYIGCTGENDTEGDRVLIQLHGAITYKQFIAEAELVQRDILTLQFPLSKLPHSMTLLASKTMKKQRYIQ